VVRGRHARAVGAPFALFAPFAPSAPFVTE